MKKKIKKNEEKNILLCSFTETKFSFYNYLKNTKKYYSKKSKIFLGNIKKNSFHNYFDNFIKIPKFSNKNLSKIISILEKNHIKLVIPTSDQELKFWSQNYNYFEQRNIKIHIMTYKKIIHFLNKKNFYYFCKNKNILTPEIYSLKNLPTNSKMVLKEVENDKYKGIVMTNLNKNKIKLNIKKYRKPLIQQFINGQEYSIDTWKSEKTKDFEFIIRKRLLVKNGDSKITQIITDKRIKKIIKQDLSKFDYYNHCLFQAILCKGKFYYIECNPRFGGASVASLESKVKSIHHLYSEIFNRKVRCRSKKFNIQYKFETTYYK